MIFLQIEKAAGLFSTVAEQGVVFGLLCSIILALLWVIRKQYKDSKDKSIAHGVTMDKKDAEHAAAIKLKDDRIDEELKKNHSMALKNVETMKDWIEVIRSLRNV